jgi:hypothetical protein
MKESVSLAHRIFVKARVVLLFLSNTVLVMEVAVLQKVRLQHFRRHNVIPFLLSQLRPLLQRHHCYYCNHEPSFENRTVHSQN